MDVTIRTTFTKFYEANSDVSETYTLVFSFDDKPFSTNFKFNAGGLSNGCIKITFADSIRVLDSHISTNSPEKQCFSPPLTKDNLPEGVTQTDILQVLSTKLKFILQYPKNSVSLIDMARLINPATGKPYTSAFSLWRVLRGEPSIYEKYGYISPQFNMYRRAVRNIKWGIIKKRIINPRTGYNLEQLWTDKYPEKPITDNMTIEEVMKMVSYDEMERSVVEVPLYSEEMEARVREHFARFGNSGHYTLTKSIDQEIIGSMIENAGLTRLGTPELVVFESNDVWKRWDSRCKLLSFEPVHSGGGGKSITKRRRVRKTCRRRLRK